MFRGIIQNLLVLFIALLSTGVFSIPSPEPVSRDVEVKRHEVIPRALGGGTLRVLCLGASITYGYESSDGNGFRYELRKKLVEDGLTVNMIGSLSHGTMADNQVEGWIGLRIAEVAAKAELSLPSLPNVVCIHVGTNDMTQNFDVAHAYERLATLVDRIFTAVPGVTIIVSTLLPNANTAAAANVLQYNSDLIQVVNSRSAAGKRITLVDMHSSQFSLSDLQPDGTHPLDEGYQKMATVFYNGIVSVGSMIQPPATVSGIDDAAAPNDMGVIVNVDVSCIATVALSKTICSSTSKTQTCNPSTTGCPYGSTTTELSSQVSSVFSTASPVSAQASIVGTITTTTKEPKSSGTTTASSTLIAAIAVTSATGESYPTNSTASRTFGLTTSAAGSTPTVIVATTSKSSATRECYTGLGPVMIVTFALMGFIF